MFELTGDLDVHRIAGRCALEFEDLYAECIDATKLRLKQANFCRARLCPMCNWRRALKLKHELWSVLDAIGVGVTHKTLMLTLTEPNSEAEAFGGAIDRLLEAFNRLTKRRRWKRAVIHWFRALEISPGRNGTYHPHFHVLLMVLAEYFDPNSPLYIPQDEWRGMWQEALRTTERRIVDIRVKEDPGEVAKYVTKPGAYLRLEGEGQLVVRSRPA